MENSHKLIKEGAAALSDYQAILELQQEGLAVLDHNCIVKYMNPAAVALLDLSPEQCLGLVFPFPVRLDSPQETAVGFGGEKWAQLRFSKTSWEGAQAFLVQIKDVSDRKREEIRLRKAVGAAETRAAELEATKFVADQLNQAALFEDTIQSALETVRALLKIQAAWVLLPADNDSIHMVASFSEPSSVKTEKRTLGPAFRCEELDQVMRAERTAPSLVDFSGCMDEVGLSRSLPVVHYAIPLQMYGLPVGLLNLVPLKEIELDPQDYKMLETIGLQFSFAIQRAMPPAVSSMSGSHFQSFSQASRSISSSLDLPAILENVLKLAIELVGAEAGSLGLLNSNRSGLAFHTNLPETLPHQNLMRSENVIWGVLESGKSALLKGAALAEQLPLDFAPDAKSMVLVPVAAGRKILGVLALYTLSGAKELNDFDESIAESLGRQAGAVVHNAQLFMEVQQLTVTDPLTGLNNQKSFINQAVREMERAWRYKRSLSLISVVIDDIRAMNDRYGREIGDRIMQALGQICADGLRRVDLIGRYAGNNFILLLPETDAASARDVAERLRIKTESWRLDTSEGPVTFTISLGIAGLVDSEVIDLERFIDRANQALYTAIQAGGNRYLAWEPGKKIR